MQRGPAKEQFINFRKLGFRKRDSRQRDAASASSDSPSPRSVHAKKFDFSREQQKALASRKLKELVGLRKEAPGPPKPGFGDMYEDLLDDSSLSLLNEQDWRRLIERKEVHSSRLTDIYEKKVHHFFEGKTRRLTQLINELIVNAYGKELSPEAPRNSQTYQKYIKNHGKFQFLDRSLKLKHRGPSPEKRACFPGSARMTLHDKNAFHQLSTSASADPITGIRFRRFGKNRAHYKKIIGLILKYFKQIKDFAFRLNGHFHFFIQMDDHNRGEGWFQFKSMVYQDLMKLLFRDLKVPAFLTHLRSFFEQNDFYSLRFQDMKRNLDLIDTHISAFVDRFSLQVDSGKDALNIVHAFRSFKNRGEEKRIQRKRRRRVKNKNRSYLQKKEEFQKLSSLAQNMMTHNEKVVTDETEFDFLKQMLLRCFAEGHDLVFLKEFPEAPTKDEIRDLRHLTFQKLKSLLIVSEHMSAWFLYDLNCLHCQQRISFVHFTEKLSLSLTSVNNIPRRFLTHKKKKFEEQKFQLELPSASRVSHPYSFRKSQLVQDRLGSQKAKQVLSSEKHAELDSTIEERTQTNKKRKRRKRKKKAKNESATLAEAKGSGKQQATKVGGTQTLLFSQLASKEKVSEVKDGGGVSQPGDLPHCELPKTNASQQILEDMKEPVHHKTLGMILEAMKGLGDWREATLKLKNKRKDERSRKKGQRRNKKLRMNEDLRAVKAYVEWKEALPGRPVGPRLSGKGVWERVRKSLVIHKRL